MDAGDATTHLARWRSWQLAGVVHTAIERDGTMSGPALGSLRAVCAAFGGDVVASGGVTTLDDVAACARRGSGRSDRGAGAARGAVRPRARHSSDSVAAVRS